MGQQRAPKFKKSNFPETWPAQEVVQMHDILKGVVDAGTRAKQQGAVKRVCLKRDVEELVRKIFLKKRGIEFRRDTGSCIQSENSKWDLDPDWKIKGWFDAAKMALQFLKTDYKKASLAGGMSSDVGRTEQQEENKGANIRQNSISGVKRTLSQVQTTQPAQATDISLPTIAAPSRQSSGRLNGILPAERAQVIIDPEAASGARVAIIHLTMHGVARLVEYAFQRQQPQPVHKPAHFNAGQRFVTEGLTGQDLASCSCEEHLQGVVNGPPGRRLVVVRAIDEYLSLGGVPRCLIDRWAAADPGHPLGDSPPQQLANVPEPIVARVKPEP